MKAIVVWCNVRGVGWMGGRMRYLTNPELSELVSAVLIGGRNWNGNREVVISSFSTNIPQVLILELGEIYWSVTLMYINADNCMLKKHFYT